MASTPAPLASWQRWCLRFGKLSLSILLAIQLASIVWQVIAPTPLTLIAPSQSGGQSPAHTHVQGAAQYHLFGIPSVAPMAEVSEEVDAPQTRLPLILLGITRSLVDKNTSTAIIAQKGQNGEFYRIGDKVQGNTRLAAVYENRVILDSNGQLETLTFEQESSSGIDAKRIAQPSPSNTPKKRPELRSRFRNVQNPTEFMNVLTDEANADPYGLITQLGLESSGSGQGYTVQAESMLLALDLQAGDIILSINGHALGDAQSDQALLQDVGKDGRARIEVQRGDNRFVVNHRIR